MVNSEFPDGDLPVWGLVTLFSSYSSDLIGIHMSGACRLSSYSIRDITTRINNQTLNKKIGLQVRDDNEFTWKEAGSLQDLKRGHKHYGAYLATISLNRCLKRSLEIYVVLRTRWHSSTAVLLSCRGTALPLLATVTDR